MKEYHQPKKEKRMLVILPEDEYADWLHAGPDDSWQFIKQFPAEMLAVDPSIPPATQPSTQKSH